MVYTAQKKWEAQKTTTYNWIVNEVYYRKCSSNRVYYHQKIQLGEPVHQWLHMGLSIEFFLKKNHLRLHPTPTNPMKLVIYTITWRFPEMEVPQYHPNLDHFSNLKQMMTWGSPILRDLYIYIWEKHKVFGRLGFALIIPNDIHISPISPICLLASTAAPERPPGIFQHDRPPQNIEPWLVRWRVCNDRQFARR